MKKFSAFMLGLCLFAGLLSGCGSSEEAADEALLGTWVWGDYDTGYIFNSDLSGTDTFFDLGFTYTTDDGTLTITYDAELYGSVSYTYEVNEDTLTMTRISSDDSEEPDSYTYIREGSDAQAETESETEEETSSDESGESDESAQTESETAAQ